MPSLLLTCIGPANAKGPRTCILKRNVSVFIRVLLKGFGQKGTRRKQSQIDLLVKLRLARGIPVMVPPTWCRRYLV